MTATELKAKIDALNTGIGTAKTEITAQLDKATAEITAAIAELKRQIEAGEVPQEVTDAFAALESTFATATTETKAKVQVLDDLHPDAPPPA